MAVNEGTDDFFVGQIDVGDDRTIPEMSFLDDLDTESRKLVELIMAAGTGRKDIIQQLKLSSTTHRRIYAE